MIKPPAHSFLDAIPTGLLRWADAATSQRPAAANARQLHDADVPFHRHQPSPWTPAPKPALSWEVGITFYPSQVPHQPDG
jgi:hypothetical protein